MGHLGMHSRGETSVKQCPHEDDGPAGHRPGDPLSTESLPGSVADSCILAEKELLRHKQVFWPDSSKNTKTAFIHLGTRQPRGQTDLSEVSDEGSTEAWKNV